MRHTSVNRSVVLRAYVVLSVAKDLHLPFTLSAAPALRRASAEVKDLHVLLLALLLLSAAPRPASAQQSAADKATEQVLLRLENEFAQAVVKRDAATLVMKGAGPHGAFTNRYRYTDTFVKLDGRWQCIASQDYLMPEKKR